MRKYLKPLTIFLVLILIAVLAFCFWILFGPVQITTLYYYSPEEIANHAKIGDNITLRQRSLTATVNDLHGNTIAYDYTWQCEVKSQDLTDCLLQSNKSPTNVVVAFPTSHGIQPHVNQYVSVLVIAKYGDTLLTVAESTSAFFS